MLFKSKRIAIKATQTSHLVNSSQIMYNNPSIDVVVANLVAEVSQDLQPKVTTTLQENVLK